jgi:6-pyruvoyltetrahydropterin/6-carboxytetrahydropterin synthase
MEKTMPRPVFRTELQKESMVFSAAHFITFNGNVCESLHGHNYGVRCSVEGPLDENGYVCDFIALRDGLAEIVATLDHKVLLPTEHPQIKVASDDREVTARFEDRRWIFPLADCALLPVSNTTAELLADYIAGQLKAKTRDKFGDQISKLTVGVDENRGQWGVVEVDW